MTVFPVGPLGFAGAEQSCGSPHRGWNLGLIQLIDKAIAKRYERLNVFTGDTKFSAQSTHVCVDRSTSERPPSSPHIPVQCFTAH
jgi:hypothetical protein